MKTKEIKKIRYPSLNQIIRLYPNPEILLGHEIFWEGKEDGSNIGVWLDDDGMIQLRSRNQDKADDNFYEIFKQTEEYEKILEFLIDMRTQWHDECVVFGELLTKGRSPTRIKLYDKHKFIVFDIWSRKCDGLIPYMLVHQYCYHFEIPIVELYGTSKHITLKSLLRFRDKMLKVAKKKGTEGVVGKTFEKNVKFKYVKEKLDLPKIEKKPRHIEEGVIQLPSLPESEILGALDKVLVDIGHDRFKDVRESMPLFAKYVKIEYKKHNCSCNEKLFKYYKQKLEDLNDKNNR